MRRAAGAWSWVPPREGPPRRGLPRSGHRPGVAVGRSTGGQGAAGGPGGGHGAGGGDVVACHGPQLSSEGGVGNCTSPSGAPPPSPEMCCDAARRRAPSGSTPACWARATTSKSRSPKAASAAGPVAEDAAPARVDRCCTDASHGLPAPEIRRWTLWGVQEGRQVLRDALGPGGAALLLVLQRLPVGDDLVGSADRDVAEDVGGGGRRAWRSAPRPRRRSRRPRRRWRAGRGRRSAAAGPPAPPPGPPCPRGRWRRAPRTSPRSGGSPETHGSARGPRGSRRGERSLAITATSRSNAIAPRSAAGPAKVPVIGSAAGSRSSSVTAGSTTTSMPAEAAARRMGPLRAPPEDGPPPHRRRSPSASPSGRRRRRSPRGRSRTRSRS